MSTQSESSNEKPRRLALIAGGKGELGQAFLREFLHQKDWHVVVADVGQQQNPQLTTSAIPAGNVEERNLDVTDAAEWQTLIESLRQRYESLDLLINAAGLAAGGEVDQFPQEDFSQVMQVNYFGTLNGCQAVIPWMKQTGRGHIINIASITGLLAPPGMAAYASSKAAVAALTESLYAELKAHGIGVTLCAPGFFPSPLIQRGIFRDAALQQQGQQYMSNAKLTAGAVAKAALRAARRKKLFVIVGRRARFYWRLKRLAPCWLHRRLESRCRERSIA